MNNSTVIDEIEIDLAERVTALDLYRRWEMQQWQAQSLEYERDAEGWTRLPAFARLPLLATLARFLVGETTVTETLAPLAYAAPEVDYKMYLATQLADEARHTVFFRRYLAFLSGDPRQRGVIAGQWRRSGGRPVREGARGRGRAGAGGPGRHRRLVRGAWWSTTCWSRVRWR